MLHVLRKLVLLSLQMRKRRYRKMKFFMRKQQSGARA